MNSATGIIREGATDQDSSDRRRGIKLVARKKSGKAFRINIADELLNTFPGHQGAPEKAQTDLEAVDTKSVQPAPNHLDDSLEKRSTGSVTFVLATAAATGLIVGYLAGRRRD